MKGSIYKILVLVLVAASLMAACGGSPTATPTAAPAPTKAAAPTAAPVAATPTTAPVAAAPTAAPAQKVTLQFWTRLGDNAQVTDMVNTWNKAHPETQIALQGIPGGDYRTKLLASVAGGNPPDIVGMDVVIMPVYFNQNALLPIDDFMAAEGASFKSDFKAGLWYSTQAGGKTYGVPWWSDPSALFYNVDMATKAGFPNGPQTWDDLKAIAAASNKVSGNADTDVYGAVFPVIDPSVMFTWLPYLWGAGGDLLDANNCAAFNNAAGTSAMQLWVDLYKNGYMPRSAVFGTDATVLSNLFASGHAAMWVGSSSILTQVAKVSPNMKVGAVPMPGPKAGAQSSYLGGDNLVIMKATKYPKQAWDFIKYMVGGDLMKQYAMANSGVFVSSLMTRSSGYTADYFTKFPIQQALVQTAGVGRAPNTPFLTEARVPVYNSFQAALAGTQTIQQGLADAETKVNQIAGCKK